MDDELKNFLTKTTPKLLVGGILLVFVFQLGQFNAYILEQQIQDYCSEETEYIVSDLGFSAGLWKSQPNIEAILTQAEIKGITMSPLTEKEQVKKLNELMIEKESQKTFFEQTHSFGGT